MPLDPRADILIGLIRDQRAELAEQIVARLRAEVPSYAAVSSTELAQRLDVTISLVIDTLLGPGIPSDATMAVFSELGRTRARDGVDADTLIRAIRISARTAIEFAQQRAPEAEIDAPATLALAAALWDSVDTIIDHVKPANPQHEARLAKDALARRLVAACAEGASRDDIVAAATACGLDASGDYYVVRASTTVQDERTVFDALESSAPAKGIAVAVHDEVVAVLSKVPQRSVSFIAAVGPRCALGDAATSFAVAGRVLRAATHPGFATLADVGLDVLVGEDAQVGDALVARYVTPLLAMGDFGYQLLESITSYFAHGQNVQEAARDLVIHPNTLRYRLAKVEEITGANLHSPRQIAELWWALARHSRAD